MDGRYACFIFVHCIVDVGQNISLYDHIANCREWVNEASYYKLGTLILYTYHIAKAQGLEFKYIYDREAELS